MTDLQRRNELRRFLMAHRAKISPDDVGLPSRARRRTPGLRREDVAELAGVSVSWYTLFEMARDRRVSSKMVLSVARALRLDADDTGTLFALALTETSAVADARRDAALHAAARQIAKTKALANRLFNASCSFEAKEVAVVAVNDIVRPRIVTFFTESAVGSQGFVLSHVEGPRADALLNARNAAIPYLIAGGLVCEEDITDSQTVELRERAARLGPHGYIAAPLTTQEGTLLGGLGYAEPVRHYSPYERHVLELCAELLTQRLSLEMSFK